MKKACRILVAGLSLIFAVAIGVPALLPHGPGVTKTNFDRIKKGMKVAEVEEILGSKMFTSTRFYLGGGAVGFGYWRNDDGARIQVSFFNDEVSNVEWIKSTETVFQKFRRWLHLS